MKRLLFFAALAALTSGAGELERIAAVTHPDLAEMSGIVASSYPGVFWVHNDSGDSPRIFAIRPDAAIVVPGFIRVIYPDRTSDDWPGYTIDNAWNSDWEDIALDSGVLYLADVGNNGNARRDLGVYVVNEFPPDAVHKARAAKFLGIRYPDQSEYPAKLWHFDCEAVFTFDDKLYFLTKHRRPGKHTEFERGTKLYRLDSAFTDQDNVLTLIDKHDGLTLPTGADVSPDGQHLAIVTYQRLWVFERPRRGDKWLQSTPQVLDFDRDVVKQNEAIGWESNDSLLMTNENREIFRIPLSALTEG